MNFRNRSSLVVCAAQLACLWFGLLSNGAPHVAHAQDASIGEPCINHQFRCLVLTVPLDHFGKRGDSTFANRIQITFAVLPATGQRKGMLLTANGGPGASGIANAERQAARYSPTLREQFDLVFFDPRGVGQSGYLDCPVAYDQRDFVRGETKAQERKLVHDAKVFVDACLGEMQLDDPQQVRYYSTRQTVEDIEVFRKTINQDQLWIYGESYGSVLAQRYAEAHSGRVAGLILDSPIDLQQSMPKFLQERALVFDRLLREVLSSCQEESACAKDSGGHDLVATFDRINKQLRQSEIDYAFPMDNGEVITRHLRRNAFEAATADLLRSLRGRMLLQRMMSAASRGDYTLIGREIGYVLMLEPSDNASIQATTIFTPTDSEAMFFAVQCADYQYFDGSLSGRTERYLRAGDPIDQQLRLAYFFYEGMPCLFWPGNGSASIPFNANALRSIPVLVIAASADMQTPPENATRIHRQLANSALIWVTGGKHVMLHRSNDCVDEAVHNFLLVGRLPKTKKIFCADALIQPYVPLAPVTDKALGSPLQAMRSFEDNVFELPEYVDWSADTVLQVGCPNGGIVRFEYVNRRDTLTFQSCAFTRGFALTGTGWYDSRSDTTIFSVEISGKHQGHLEYQHHGDDMQVAGTIDHRAIP